MTQRITDVLLVVVIRLKSYYGNSFKIEISSSLQQSVVLLLQQVLDWSRMLMLLSNVI